VKAVDRRRMTTNRHKWDESVPLHVASATYDVRAFLRGKSTLEPVEIREIGPVRGKSLLHLQCHFGLDTLSWARRGARVTGVDFSFPAVRVARRLARQTRVPARFLHSNIYDLSGKLDEQFDIVYTAKGALCWLPDLDAWAKVVARFLRPGGTFYLLEDHPIAELFENHRNTTTLKFELPYFSPGPVRDVYDGTYATDAKMKHRVSYSWIRPVSKVISALIDSGVRIEAVHEFPYCYWQRFPFMTEDARGYWHLNENEGRIPLMWSVKGTRSEIDRGSWRNPLPRHRPARTSRRCDDVY
jgi:SAM-dependent methyltransferase